MSTTKQAYKSFTAEAAGACEVTGLATVLIQGLEATGQFVDGVEMFRLHGVQPRNVPWFDVMTLAGYIKPGQPEMPEDVRQLVDKLERVMFEHDIVRVLAERIKTHI